MQQVGISRTLSQPRERYTGFTRTLAIHRVLAGFALAALACCASAWAGINVPVHSSRVQPYQVSDNDPHAIPLNDAGKTKLGFNFGVDYKYHLLVRYNADCVVQGTGGYVAITILVDNNPAQPNGPDVVLCSETPASGVPVSAVRISYAHTARRPDHHIQIIAKGVNTTFWQLSNSFLAVEF